MNLVLISLNVELNITMIRQFDQIKNRFFFNTTTGSEPSKMAISRSMFTSHGRSRLSEGDNWRVA